MYHLIWWKWRSEGFSEICRWDFWLLSYWGLNWIWIRIPRETLRISKKQQTPYFHTSTTAREWRCENMGFVVVFFLKYKIGNNDFTTILGSVNVKNMTPTTICSSNPTENVLGGSIDHTESSWTLNITPILLTSGVDLIFGFQKQIYHISGIF